MSKLSRIQLDYLAEIYQVGYVEGDTTDGFIASSTLAERLFTSQSGVNRMLERLREAGLILHQRYVGVQLTPDGLRAAQALMRKQGVIEAFLVVVMGFGWHEVSNEARTMRHHVNERVARRMWQLAGRPATSPFGEPITPDAELPPTIPGCATQKPNATISWPASSPARPTDCNTWLHWAWNPDRTSTFYTRHPSTAPYKFSLPANTVSSATNWHA